jgi:signal transduction histidine kinase
MKLPPLFGSFRGWWFIVALVVGPAIVLAALGLRALSLERTGREQELWREQSRLVLLVDGAISNAIAAMEGDLRRGESRNAVNSRAQDVGKSVPFPRFVFDRRQLLIFPEDRVFFGEIGLRPEQAPTFSLSGQVVQVIEQAQTAEAQDQDETALIAYRRIRTSEPRLRPWVELSIARIQYRQRGAELASALQQLDWGREDSISPSGIPVAMLACSYAAQLPDDRRAAFEGLFRQALANLRRGRWWLAHNQRAFYDEELVRLLRSVKASTGFPVEKDARLDELAAIEKSVRQSPPRRRDGSTRDYNSTENGGFLLLWSPADDLETWNGAAIQAERIGEWLKPLLSPLLEGLQFGVAVRDSRQKRLWTDAAGGVPAARWERLRSVPEWELGFIEAAEAAGIDPKRILWYGFILLPMVMLIVGIAAATRVVRKELELGRMQSDFIAAVSHEFKSPLTSIRLLAERIAGRRHSSSESIDEYCSAMDKEASRLERLVNRLLEWQQIEAGQKHYRFEPSSLAEIARSAVELLRPQAEAKGVSLDLKAAGEMPDIRIDRAAMTDVLENLIDNAVKYSRAGGRVSVELHADDVQVTVEVSDEGIGIAPEDLPRIFEKFYRGSRGNQEDVRGTGLGLSLVKAALDAHGGKADVKSTPGKGSCFTLTLPIRREEEEHAPDIDRG